MQLFVKASPPAFDKTFAFLKEKKKVDYYCILQWEDEVHSNDKKYNKSYCIKYSPLQSKHLKRSAQKMINAFINPKLFGFLASNFENSTEYCNHPTVASIRMSNVDWTNNKMFQIRKMFSG